MNHTNQFHPTVDKEKMLLTYGVQLSQREACILRPLGGRLLVNLKELVAPLDLFGSDKSKLEAGKPIALGFALMGNPNSSDDTQPVFDLGTVFPYTTFMVKDFREVYAFVNLIACHVENSFILQAPMTPQQGFQRTWSADIDVPRGFFDVEVARRVIHIHKSKPKIW